MAAVINISDARPGASPDEWAHFDMVLGLTADLLPVVSNPRAVISQQSTMKSLGKTPSKYNAQRQAVGIANWTQYEATPQDIATWSRERDYGISLQTRSVRALDVDVPDAEEASAIRTFIADRITLPSRERATSAKFLVAFECVGELRKRVVKTRNGIIEFLAGGNQFIAAGAHIEKDGVSRSRYEWRGGLPDAFPVLSAAQFEALWADLAVTFGVEAPTESGGSVKAQKLADAAAADPVAQFLLNAGRVKRAERDGRLHITCPFEDEHTSESSETATTYFPAHTGGYANGHFQCLHAHCEHRSDQEFLDGVGYVDESLLEEFSAIADAAPVGDADAPAPITDAPAETPIAKAAKYVFQHVSQMAQGKPLAWLIKGVLPKADVGVLFGETGAGKSFMVTDMAVSIALGEPWRGIRTRQARVAYIVAEGSAGFRSRLQALAQQRNLDLATVSIFVLPATPNFLDKNDALEVAKAVVAMGGADLIIVDTWSQVTAGGNENSGEDMGRALTHCRGIQRATGAMVLLVHHSGKDGSRGARGWSGLKGAADVELEVVRVDDRRSITVTKMKDGPGEGKEYAFRLNTVVLGLDEDGDERTSCVVDHVSGEVRRVAQAKLGVFEQAVMEAVEGLSGLAGGAPALEDVIREAVLSIPHDVGDDRRRDNVKRAAANLCDKKGLLVRDGVGLRLKSQISAD